MGTINLINQRFGRLTVIARGPNNKHNQKQWYCKCDCGKEKLVSQLLLRNGKTKSCGCLHHDLHTKHGMYNTRVYSIWHNMNSRCNNNSNEYYGGKGIIVADRWKGENGFLNFLEDMGLPPSDEYSIDRIDNNKDYTPGNCKWSTTKEQSINKTTTKLSELDVIDIRILYKKGTNIYADLSRMYNCDPSYIRKIVIGERR